MSGTYVYVQGQYLCYDPEVDSTEVPTFSSFDDDKDDDDDLFMNTAPGGATVEAPPAPHQDTFIAW